jgi:KDO2-lipid IV(A) lauroyltransferase
MKIPDGIMPPCHHELISQHSGGPGAVQSYIVYFLTRAALLGCQLLPRCVARALLQTLALAAYALDARHRHIAQVNLRIAFPEFSRRQRASLARRSFQNTALNLLEVSRLPLLSPANIAQLVHYDPQSGLQNFERALGRGKGILYLTGHFSAWELLPAAHALFGHPLSFLTRPLDNPYLERYLMQVRESSGNRVISKRNSARAILHILKKGGAVGILMDQNTSLHEGTYAELFGVPAATTTGLALLALRTDAAVLPGYLQPKADGRYAIKFLPPLDLIRTGDMSRDLQLNTARFNQVLEQIIREQPETWLWGHKRWKNQPEGNPQDIYSLSDDALDAFLQQRQAARASG